jgi:hypothetical protein
MGQVSVNVTCKREKIRIVFGIVHLMGKSYP